VYAFSMAANILLSSFPFFIVMVTICRYLLQWDAAEQAIYIALNDYFPDSDFGKYIIRNLKVVVDQRGPFQLVSVLLLLFTANGIFEPLEVALNRAWGITKNRSYLRNQLVRGADRFRWIDASGHARTSGRELLGFRTADYYLLTEEGLRELCGEHDIRAVLRALKNDGHLWHDKDRLTRKSPKIEEFGDSRLNLYWINIAFMGEQALGDTDEDLKIAGRAAVTVSRETARKRAPLGPDDDIPF